MRNYLFLLLSLFLVNCSLFERQEMSTTAITEPPKADEPKRMTKKNLEDDSMLGEGSGSLWVSRGQSSFLFANNNQRLLGDLLNVNIDGYPKEQIQMKVSTIAKLLAQILNDQSQEIRAKQDELKKFEKKPEPIFDPKSQKGVQNRAPAAVASIDEEIPEDNRPTDAQIAEQKSQQAKALRTISDEQEEVQALQKAKDFPIRSVPTRITDILKDGSYRVRGTKPFMIGKREYQLVVAGMVKPDDFDDKGVSAESLMDPTFDIISEKKTEEL